MLKDIVAVKPSTGYELWLTFEDGIEGVVDISQLIEFSGIFAPLQDPATFAQVQVHPELGTLIWQNGVDLDPDVLYAVVSGSPIVFDDPNCLMMDDPKHSLGESRFLILGYSIVQRLPLVVHCDRGITIRIISARPATPSERRNYERGN